MGQVAGELNIQSFLIDELSNSNYKSATCLHLRIAPKQQHPDISELKVLLIHISILTARQECSPSTVPEVFD